MSESKGPVMDEPHEPVDDLRRVLLRSWHARYGLPERMDQLKDMLAEVEPPLCNENGHLISGALSGLIQERDALRQFADRMLAYWPDSGVDGYDLEEAAIECGLLVLKDPAPTRPCGEDGCRCVDNYGTDDNGEFDGGPIECYTRTALVGQPLKETP